MLEVLLPCVTERGLARLRCVRLLSQCYAEWNVWGPTTGPRKLVDYARRHLILYANMRRYALDDACWTLKPKHHLFLELADECSPGNPADGSLKWGGYARNHAAGMGV
eukprot:1282749-Pyramimonas_sp.AAC.1